MSKFMSDRVKNINPVIYVWLMMGDLNARHVSMGHRANEDMGLEEILLNGSGLVVNQLIPTYRRFGTIDNFSILDLCVCSPGMANKLLLLQVLSEKCMGSDHFQLRRLFRLFEIDRGFLIRGFFNFRKQIGIHLEISCRWTFQRMKPRNLTL